MFINPHSADVHEEFEFTPAEFQRLRDFVHRHTGIALAEGKRELVYGRLARRIRELKLRSFAQYCKLVEMGDPLELQELTNAITTNLTSFFREKYHFEQLASEVLPQIAAQQDGRRRLRLWSAGCSTGQEPYSLAMVLREHFADLRSWDARILASDIDSKVLAVGAQGRYRADQLGGLPGELLQRWFAPVAGSPEVHEARPDLKSLIAFRRLNLIGPWPMGGPFDIIFCRNVVIYFDKDTQRTLFERMAELQRPGGWLYVGHAETLHSLTDRYKLVGRTIYRRLP